MTRVITNTVVSLDGKITARDAGHVSLGSDADKKQMDEIRLQADAILVGGQTFRNWPQALYSEQASRPILNVIVSRRLDLTFSIDYLGDPHIKPLVITDSAEIPKQFSVECLRISTGVTPAAILSVLQSRGVNTLLIEGGGDIIFQFVRDDLIDEIYVTICPRIIGGQGTASLVGGEGFFIGQAPQLHLQTVKSVGDEVFLHYKTKRVVTII